MSAERTTIAVLDIDGVLADIRHRLHFVQRRPKDWDSFFAAMVDDDVLPEGVAIAARLAQDGHEVVYVTGRPASYRAVTTEWLQRHGFPPGELVMRSATDRRPARQFKPTALRRLAQRGRIVAAIDDDAAVIEALAAAGFPVMHATWMPAAHDPAGASHDQQSLFDAQEEDGRT